jgi:MFS family permease
MFNSSRNNLVTLHSAYLAWAILSVFYVYQYIMRASLGSMIDDLRRDFALNATEFSTLGAYSLTAYSLLQIPLGILVDRIGVKKLVLWSIFCCTCGCIVFAMANGLPMAQVGRILIGAGSACAFMCALKTVSDNFPHGKRGFLMGITLTLGSLGALANGHYTAIFVEEIGWRQVYLSLSYIGLGIFIAMFLASYKFREIKNPNIDLSIKSVLKTIKSSLSQKYVIVYAILALGLYTPFSVMADLWAPAFLQQKYNLGLNASAISSTMFLGLAVGSLLLPWLCEKYNLLNIGIKVCCCSIFIILCLILYSEGLSLNMLLILLFSLGFFCGAEMMCFTGALRSANVNNSGEIIGFVNTLNMLGGAFLQYSIGFILDYLWYGNVTSDGMRIYSANDYMIALSTLSVIVGFCFLLSFLLREKV